MEAKKLVVGKSGSMVRSASGPQWETGYIRFRDESGKSWCLWEDTKHYALVERECREGETITLAGSFRGNSISRLRGIATEDMAMDFE